MELGSDRSVVVLDQVVMYKQLQSVRVSCAMPRRKGRLTHYCAPRNVSERHWPLLELQIPQNQDAEVRSCVPPINHSHQVEAVDVEYDLAAAEVVVEVVACPDEDMRDVELVELELAEVV